MGQYTVRTTDGSELDQRIEERIAESDRSKSETLRDLLRRGFEADHLGTELSRCRNARRQILAQREEHSDLVAAVERERSLEEQRSQAGAITRLRWWWGGMPAEGDE